MAVGAAELAQRYGVARNTVIKGLRRLAEDGLVESVPNWGTFRARKEVSGSRHQRRDRLAVSALGEGPRQRRPRYRRGYK